MARILIENMKCFAYRKSITVLLDDFNIGSIKPNTIFEASILNGAHSLLLISGNYRTDSINFQSDEGEIVTFDIDFLRERTNTIHLSIKNKRSATNRFRLNEMDHRKNIIQHDILDDIWHKILGVNQSTSPDGIRNAYISLMKLYHPDKIQLLSIEARKIAESKAMDINQAYSHVKRKYNF